VVATLFKWLLGAVLARSVDRFDLDDIFVRVHLFFFILAQMHALTSNGQRSSTMTESLDARERVRRRMSTQIPGSRGSASLFKSNYLSEPLPKRLYGA
jgi:hypothetical protein